MMMVNNLEHISEDAIKRAALSFLKTYYKFRPRTGETKVSSDNIHPSGIIADGFLEFPDENNKIFTATFEATSADKIDEVKFSTHFNDLNWDSLVFGTVVTLILLGALWQFSILTIAQSGFAITIASTLLMLCAFSMGYFQFNKKNSKYRYIYAIEQFKSYFADEQWIALGSTVFDSSSDANYIELKNQCIKNGIGLFLVNDDEQVDLKFTSAREDVFQNHRKKIQFSHESAAQNFNKNDYSRFSNQHYIQIITSLGSLALIVSMMYGQYLQVANNKVIFPENRVKELEYKGSLVPETPDIYVSPINKLPMGKNSQNQANVAANSEVGLYVFVPGSQYVAYPCERVNIKGIKFIVQDSEQPDFAAAKKRIEELAQFELVANCISLKCLKRLSKGYAVYFEFIFNNEEDATQRFIQIKNQFKTNKLPLDALKMRMLIF